MHPKFKVFGKKIKLWPKKQIIKDQKGLQVFLTKEISKISGELTIKYCQKRLGKLHYRLSIDDPKYVQELIDCQLKLHAEVLADICHLIGRLLGYDKVESSQILSDLMRKIHDEYGATAPYGSKSSFYLTPEHYQKNEIDVNTLIQETGSFLFDLLPMTENLQKSNVTIFRGQIKSAYINLLENFSSSVDLETLEENIRK